MVTKNRGGGQRAGAAASSMATRCGEKGLGWEDGIRTRLVRDERVFVDEEVGPIREMRVK